MRFKKDHEDLVKVVCKYMMDNHQKFDFLEYDDLTEDCNYYVFIRKVERPNENRFATGELKVRGSSKGKCADCFWFSVCDNKVRATHPYDDSESYIPSIGCPIFRFDFEELHEMLERLKELIAKEMSYEQSNKNREGQVSLFD